MGANSQPARIKGIRVRARGVSFLPCPYFYSALRALFGKLRFPKKSRCPSGNVLGDRGRMVSRRCERKDRDREIQVVYHLQQLSGNSGWKVNGTRLFGSFQWKISGSNGTSEKVVLFFRTECSKRKFVYHLFKPNL